MILWVDGLRVKKVHVRQTESNACLCKDCALCLCSDFLSPSLCVRYVDYPEEKPKEEEKEKEALSGQDSDTANSKKMQ